jgi:hypothetical protein
MAGWTTSYVVPSTLVSGLESNANRINLDLSSVNSSSLYLAVFDNTVTPNVDTDPQSYGVAPWNTGESTGTNWPAGGVALTMTGAGLSHQSGGNLLFTAGNVSVANTTLSDPIYGCLIYAQGLSPKAVVCAVWFGGSGYTTSAGPFGITWPASGVFTIPLVP